MGGYFSKTPINFKKRVKYDIVFIPHCSDYNLNSIKCNKNKLQEIKKYLENHLYNYINIYFSNGGYSNLSEYYYIQKLKKKDIKKVKYIDNTFIVSISTKLVNQKKYKDQILYLERFINGLKEEINHRLGGASPHKKKTIEMDFKFTIYKIINISN